MTNRNTRGAAAPQGMRPVPAELPRDALLTIDEVLLFVPVSRASWYRGVRRGEYPKPKAYGRRSLWNSRDIARLIHSGPKRARSSTDAPADTKAAA